MDDVWPLDGVVSMGALAVRLTGQVRSTQDELWAKRRWLQEGAGIAASSQTAGAGRGEAQWLSPEGGVYLSMLVGKGIAAADADVLGEAAALAVLRTSREILKDEPLFAKWPNDIVTWGPSRTAGKLAGVLVRTEVEGDEIVRAAVGIGLNVRAGVEKSPLAAKGVSAVSLEGLARRAKAPWTATRAKVLEWVVGWFGTLLTQARADPASVRSEFGREVSHGTLLARVTGAREQLKPLGVERGGALVVRRQSGKKATVSFEDAERLVWRMAPKPAARKRRTPASTSKPAARHASP